MPNRSESPQVDADSFRCPHCRIVAEQNWQDVEWTVYPKDTQVGRISRCSYCRQYTIWVEDELYYPKSPQGPLSHPEMPEEVERDFQEARLVVGDSPRAAAALLRLAIQRFVDEHLEAEGDSLYQKIGYLVNEGRISERIQRALDAVRVIGNNSVHPGRMDMDDGEETAYSLFGLVNEIVDETLGRDARVDGIFGQLPEGAIEGIERRDQGDTE